MAIALTENLTTVLAAMSNDSPLESYWERQFRKVVEADDNECVKLYKKRGWPDRLVLLGYGISFFIECKRKNLKLRKLQKYIAEMLRAKGYDVYEIDTKEEAIKIYNQYKEIAAKKEKKRHPYR